MSTPFRRRTADRYLTSPVPARVFTMRIAPRSALWAPLVLSLLSWQLSPAFAQRVVIPSDHDGTTAAVYPEGAIVIETASTDGRLEPIVYDPAEIGRFVVVFSAPPLALAHAEAAGKQADIAAAVDLDHERFRQDLESLTAAASKRGGGRSEVHHSYRKVLNGVSLTARRDVAHQLGSLPYVSGVFDDVEMRASDQNSNRVIGADRARSELGATGQGIVVAIIDTGIDYTHPALGAGFGNGFKVAGGYDFVDDDDDPMDGHGHGTHVAGIVAGDDGEAWMGVAPSATLLAYRVLNDSGFGQSSAVIAGIERAVTDGAHIINLSLGGTGHADDPTSQAVDNATAAGVLSVVAAGNSGQAFSIASPGSARTALTVGATNNDDDLASFSSRGPTNIGFENKPDVVAPGVTIYSSVLDGRFANYSGTSMATPHAAGAAALLLQRRPSWTAHDLKSALTHSVTDLGLNLWHQGAGRIDVMAADSMTASIYPVSLSFGNLDPDHSQTQFTRTLTIRNLSTSAQNWSFSPTHSLPGTTITLSPTSLSLPAGSSGTVTVTARFEPSKIAFPSQIDVPYTGMITATTTGRTMRIPFSVTKTPQLTIDFDEPPFAVDVLNSQSGYARAMSPGTLVSFPLPGGVYDVMMMFALPNGDSHSTGYVIREGIHVSGKHAISVRRNEIKNSIRLKPLSLSGAPHSPDYTFVSLERKALNGTGWFTYSGFIEGEPVIPISDVSSRFKVEAQTLKMFDESGDAYSIPFLISGISSSVTLQNNPDAFRSITTEYVVPDSVSELFILPHIYRISGEQLMTSGGQYSVALADQHRMGPPFVRRAHYGPRPAADFGYRYTAHAVYNTTGGRMPATAGEVSDLLFSSPIVEATSSQTIEYAFRDFQNPLRSTSSQTNSQTFGRAMMAYVGRMWNIGSISTIRFDIKRAGLFAGPAGELIGGDIAYRLTSADGLVVAEETRPNGMFAGPFWGQAGRFHLDVWMSGGYVDNRAVRAHARSSFDTRLADGIYDPDPPIIEAIYLRTDEAVVSALEGDGVHSIVAEVRDTHNQGGPVLRAVGSASMSVRRLGETLWTPLSAKRSGDRFAAPWTEDLPDGYYDFRIQAEDLGGNTLDYRVEPGFRSGSITENEPPVAVTLVEPANYDFLRLHEVSGPVSFSWDTATDPDSSQTIRYVFRMTGGTIDTTITTSDIFVDLEIAELLAEGENYEWWVETTDGFELVASEVFTLRARGLNVSASPDAELPRRLTLFPNYPNPFNPSTTFEFAMPESGLVRLEVYDVTGRLVDTITNETMPAGRHTRSWDASSLASGVYIVRLATGTDVTTRRVVLMK